jgi:hypothetical protein
MLQNDGESHMNGLALASGAFGDVGVPFGARMAATACWMPAQFIAAIAVADCRSCHQPADRR